MYAYLITLGLFVFPCLVEASLVGAHPYGEMGSAIGNAPSLMRSMELPIPGNEKSPVTEDGDGYSTSSQRLRSSATFG